MQLFYNPNLAPADKSVQFDKKESGHILKVLRKSEGDKLNITNGKGIIFSAVITHANPNKCKADLRAYYHEDPLPYQLHLAVAPTKRNERFEWFLEKATEIGIGRITPLICEHSERRQIKPKRFERVIQSAMKQSLQAYLPQFEPAVDFSDFIDGEFPDQKFIAHCEEDQKRFLLNAAKPKTDTLILIGPEGDFSKDEIDRALASGFTPVSLGHHRLRTETAAVAACHTVSLLNL